MGCSTSKPGVEPYAAASGAAHADDPNRPKLGRPSLAGAYPQFEPAGDQPRAVSSGGTKPLPLAGGGRAASYAFFTQRGFYPDAPEKANQDALFAVDALGGDASLAAFGVFDGHGEHGHWCSRFVERRLPELLAERLAAGGQAAAPAGGAGDGARLEAALHAALTAVNEELHAAEVDDSLSGTTACVMLLRGGGGGALALTVANVGDSRAVAARRGGPGGALLAQDLTTDQTPFRADECARVRAAGAQVLTLEQVEGLKDASAPCWTDEAACDGDPPRLWAPGGTYPGTAFTRSVGDALAEGIGVFAEPETATVRLGPEHAFVVLASDGVWEFLTSQQVVNIVAACGTPHEAAKTLCAVSYKAWLRRETRTDDITVVVLFLDAGAGGAANGGAESTANGGGRDAGGG